MTASGTRIFASPRICGTHGKRRYTTWRGCGRGSRAGFGSEPKHISPGWRTARWFSNRSAAVQGNNADPKDSKDPKDGKDLNDHRAADRRACSPSLPSLQSLRSLDSMFARTATSARPNRGQRTAAPYYLFLPRFVSAWAGPSAHHEPLCTRVLSALPDCRG